MIKPSQRVASINNLGNFSGQNFSKWKIPNWYFILNYESLMWNCLWQGRLYTAQFDYVISNPSGYRFAILFCFLRQYYNFILWLLANLSFQYHIGLGLLQTRLENTLVCCKGFRWSKNYSENGKCDKLTFAPNLPHAAVVWGLQLPDCLFLPKEMTGVNVSACNA